MSNDFKMDWNTWMKSLYLKGYKWLLSQNQRVRNDFFGYRRYYTRAKHIKLLKKTLKCKDFSTRWLSVSVNSSYRNCKVVNHDKNAKQFLIHLQCIFPHYIQIISYILLNHWILFSREILFIPKITLQNAKKFLDP